MLLGMLQIKSLIMILVVKTEMQKLVLVLFVVGARVQVILLAKNVAMFNGYLTQTENLLL